MTDNLTAGETFILHWQYGILGSFGKGLAVAIARADEGNLARLRLGFPDEVDAYIAFSRESGWWERLQQRVAAKVSP